MEDKRLVRLCMIVCVCGWECGCACIICIKCYYLLGDYVYSRILYLRFCLLKCMLLFLFYFLGQVVCTAQ